MCQGIPYQSLQFLGDRPTLIYSLHPSTLIFNGLEDRVVDIPIRHTEPFFEYLRQRTIRLRSIPERQRGDLFEYRFELGTGISVPSREDLNAVEPAEWRRDREKYVIETWIREAKARVAASE